MFRKLLVPLDRSDFAEQALGQAAAIARASGGWLDLVLVHQPLPFEGFGDVPWHREQWDEEVRYLGSTANEFSMNTGVPVTCAVVQGPPVDAICKRAREIDADLVVLTSHGRTGLSRAWLGSTADGLIRHSLLPVLMLRPTHGRVERFTLKHSFKNILVPLDGSPFAADALMSAIDLAKCSAASITLLRVVLQVPLMLSDAGIPFAYPYPIAAPDTVTTARLAENAKAELAAVGRRLGEQGIADVRAEVEIGGHVAPAILDFARSHEIDVIAMSTHGRGASRFFLGSVADKVLRGSGLPMLVHRPIGVPGAATFDSESVEVMTSAVAPT
jgi:nucleotide-binding universal stress UspA family protein